MSGGGRRDRDRQKDSVRERGRVEMNRGGGETKIERGTV